MKRFEDMSAPLISIIVPIYRIEHYLCKCVESLINQTYKNIEIILINDGSDDRCPEICDHYASKDKRVKAIHKENGGLHSARQAGMMAAKGAYIGYVDGDDWVAPEMYEKMIKYAQENDVDIVVGGIVDSDGNNDSLRKIFFEEGKYNDDCFVDQIEPRILYSGSFFEWGIVPSLCGKLFKRECVEGFQMFDDPANPKQFLVNDIMVALPAMLKAKSIYIMHEHLYYYRTRMDGSLKRAKYDVAGIIKGSYYTWLNECCYASPESGIERQMQFFVLSTLIKKQPGFFDQINADSVLNVYGGMKRRSRVVVYGAGLVGVNLVRYILEESPTELVAWIDRNYQQMEGENSWIHIESPDSITKKEFDYVLLAIASSRTAEAMRLKMLQIGVDDNKIRWIPKELIENPQRILDAILN